MLPTFSKFDTECCVKFVWHKFEISAILFNSYFKKLFESKKPLVWWRTILTQAHDEGWSMPINGDKAWSWVLQGHEWWMITNMTLQISIMIYHDNIIVNRWLAQNLNGSAMWSESGRLWNEKICVLRTLPSPPWWLSYTCQALHGGSRRPQKLRSSANFFD